jgi:hypothetical protein
MSGTGPHARFACGYDKVASVCQASGQVCQRCAPKRDEDHRALGCRLSMIFSENRYALFRMMLYSFTGTQISKPPLPVAGSNFSS